MEFLAPANLALLAVPLVLAIAYVIFQRRRRRYALRYASVAMLRQAVGPGPGRRRHVPALLFLFGMVLLVLAIGRPATTVKVPGFEGTVILAIDVSGSMLADDVRPTRMDAAKAAAHAFIDKQRVAKNRVRIGVVAFSVNAQNKTVAQVRSELHWHHVRVWALSSKNERDTSSPCLYS